MVEDSKKPKKIGLALGGGGAKGFAHIGVIKTLVEAGIPIDYIAGTSMGALVGGYYAATKNIRRLEALATHIEWKKYFPSHDLEQNHKNIFFRDASIEHVLDEEFHTIKIEDLQIPFTAIATDAKNGEEVRISKGKLVSAVRASAALPIIFSPVEVNGRLLIDGGLANPVPANVVREMGAEYVIAVDVSSKWLDQPEKMLEIRDMYSIIMNSISVIEYQIGKTALKSADIVLRPSVMKYEWLSFQRAPEILERGEWVADYYLRDIRKGSGYVKTFSNPVEEFIGFLFGK